MILTLLLKLPKNGEDWGKLIAAKGFKKLLKIQNITQSGHNDRSAIEYITLAYSGCIRTKIRIIFKPERSKANKVSYIGHVRKKY